MKTEASSGAIYRLGVIGSMVYFLQHATTFLEGVLGMGKVVFWPALAAYKVLGLLGL